MLAAHISLLAGVLPGVVRVPVTAAGVSLRMVTRHGRSVPLLAHGLCAASSSSTVGIETSFFSLMVNAAGWQRSAPTWRTQEAVYRDNGRGGEDLVGLRLALPHSSRNSDRYPAVCRSTGSGCPPAVRQSYPTGSRRWVQRRHFALNIQDGGSRVRQLRGHMISAVAPSGSAARADARARGSRCTSPR